MEKPRANRFPRALRITGGRDFDRVLAGGRSTADRMLAVYALPNELPYARIGIIAGKRVGKAVQRNRARRLIREAFRTTRPEVPSGFDFVAIARKSACNADYDEIKSSFVKLASRVCAKWEK